MAILDSIGKALGIESIKNVMPSLKKAMELANQNKDSGFIEKIGIFLTTFTDEMGKLDGEKEQITAETTAKVQEIATRAKAEPAPSSNPESSSEIDPDEPFVRGEDHFGNRITLRKSAMTAFQNSMKIAESKGVKLRVTSSYRDFKTQARLHAQGVEKYGSSKAAGKWVARAGHSNHHTGGTVDIHAMVQDSNGNWVGSKRHKNQRLLWDILPKAGFVNYEAEPWHWEIYTARWRSQKHIASNIYTKQESLNA
ncbi:MAG: M15 family metallopeptidase [Candidatus Peregrinibacteria bacterium]|nr:M15 family metallopeptidase [Candidatus Peregrinibacteria bacterium]